MIVDRAMDRNILTHEVDVALNHRKACQSTVCCVEVHRIQVCSKDWNGPLNVEHCCTHMRVIKQAPVMFRCTPTIDVTGLPSLSLHTACFACIENLAPLV